LKVLGKHLLKIASSRQPEQRRGKGKLPVMAVCRVREFTGRKSEARKLPRWIRLMWPVPDRSLCSPDFVLAHTCKGWFVIAHQPDPSLAAERYRIDRIFQLLRTAIGGGRHCRERDCFV